MVFSHKKVFIKNEAVLLYITMKERARAPPCSYNLVYNFLINLLPLKSSVFVVLFSNAFWHGNETFQKVVLRMKLFLYLKSFTCHVVNIRVWKCFCSCSYQNQNFSLVSHSCRLCSARVALVLHWCSLCLTRVACVWRSCCKLNYIHVYMLLKEHVDISKDILVGCFLHFQNVIEWTRVS